MTSLAWKDCGDSKSVLFRDGGQVLAEIIYAGHGTWSIKVLHRARGQWVGRDSAKAACEGLVRKEYAA